ncbi:lysophospholipid acyltransferase family protein [Paenibacillus sp. NFR01]|uniref:lysophospholipid acyltransferase family protein n=1 Tax=Paenibacillus sp. NFR01 TaxID=1566279 RepID=UPI0008B5CBCE|nr:lysophospholipid acyltransferase family protein [Paenibacillus sp. NFR01]SEU13307.1 Acyltransferase [Paenibacillus sp. NFR01]
MLEAAKSRSFDALFSRYNTLYLLRRHFRFLGISGDLQPASAGGRPLLYIMNHSSWWDGLLAYHAARVLSSRKQYFMMEEAQLRKFQFFRRLGAYSVNRNHPADVRASLRYTAGLLGEGGSVWIYPEGELLPLEHRPLQLREGAAIVLRLCPEAAVVPVTLYHGLFFHPKPEATLLAGAPLLQPWKELDRSSISALLASCLQEQLERHRRLILDNKGHMPACFRPLVKTGGSVHERYDAWRRGGR